jgi:predicted transcriptional regulator
VNTVTLCIESRDETSARALRAFGSKAQGAYISFESPELVWKVLTAKRWELLHALTGIGAVSVREAARRVGRDVKAVHGDIKALLMAGILDKTEDGKIVFPYDAVHVDFMLKAA